MFPSYKIFGVVHGTTVGILAVTISPSQRFFILQDPFVVGVDRCLDAWETPITYFNCVSIETHVQGIVLQKMYIERP